VGKKKEKKAKKSRPFNFGHLRSQKFAGLIIGIVACFCAGFFLISEPTTSAVVMGIVGLYGLFVGGRTWSDNVAVRFGGAAPSATDVEASVVKRLPKKDEEKEEKDEVD